MKDGKIIEHGEKSIIFKSPKDPYTKQLVVFQNKIRKYEENKRSPHRQRHETT